MSETAEGGRAGDGKLTLLKLNQDTYPNAVQNLISVQQKWAVIYKIKDLKNSLHWSCTFRCHILCPLRLQSEDIRLEPELHDACKKDINKLCSSFAYGNAQVKDNFDLLLF